MLQPLMLLDFLACPYLPAWSCCLISITQNLEQNMEALPAKHSRWLKLSFTRTDCDVKIIHEPKPLELLRLVILYLFNLYLSYFIDLYNGTRSVHILWIIMNHVVNLNIKLSWISFTFLAFEGTLHNCACIYTISDKSQCHYALISHLHVPQRVLSTKIASASNVLVHLQVQC